MLLVAVASQSYSFVTTCATNSTSNNFYFLRLNFVTKQLAQVFSSRKENQWFLGEKLVKTEQMAERGRPNPNTENKLRVPIN